MYRCEHSGKYAVLITNNEERLGRITPLTNLSGAWRE